MRIDRSWIALLVMLSVLFGGCSPSPPSTTPAASSSSPIASASPFPVLTYTASLVSDLENLPFDPFVDSAFLKLLERDPEYMISTDRGGWGNLNDLSDNFVRETQALEQNILILLRRYELKDLTPDQQMTARVFDWYLSDRVAAQPFLYADYSINPTVFSQHYQLLSFFVDLHPLKNQDQCESYLSCLGQVERKCLQIVEGLKKREETGVILPRPLFPSVLADLRSLALSNPSSTPFYRTLKTKTIELALSVTEREDLLTRASEEIERSVLSGYRTLYDFLLEQEKRAPEAIGLASRPGGKEYYRYLLRHYTTTELSAEEIHSLGRREMERIQSEMRTLFAQLGYPADQSLSELFTRLTRERRVLSGEEVLSTSRALIDRAEKQIHSAIDLPPNLPRVEIKQSERGNFYTPGTKGRPGIFYAGGLITGYSLPSTVYHETLPGHHLQFSLLLSLPLPACRLETNFIAWEEGWALYAELLASELGWYQGDLAGELGRLQLEAMRAARLVIDTGIHALGWTWEQAETYLSSELGLSQIEIEESMPRYASIPGQAASYMIGMQEILRLRRMAQEELGEKFDLKAFHNTILKQGEIPLPLLDEVVERWILEVSEGS